MDGLNHCVHQIGSEFLCCFCNRHFSYGHTDMLEAVAPGHGVFHPDSWKQNLVGTEEKCPVRRAMYDATWDFIKKGEK